MVKDFQKQFNRLHILIDAAVISGSYFLAWYILFGLYHEKVGRLSFAIYMQALFFIVPLYLLLNALFGLYAPKRTKGRRAEFAGILKVNTIGVLLFTLVLYLGSKNAVLYHFSRAAVIGEVIEIAVLIVRVVHAAYLSFDCFLLCFYVAQYKKKL